jgi:hypothetical protein
MKIVLFVQSTKSTMGLTHLPRATEMKFRLLQFRFVRRFGVHQRQALRLRTTVYSKLKAILLRDEPK